MLLLRQFVSVLAHAGSDHPACLFADPIPVLFQIHLTVFDLADCSRGRIQQYVDTSRQSRFSIYSADIFLPRPGRSAVRKKFLSRCTGLRICCRDKTYWLVLFPCHSLLHFPRLAQGRIDLRKAVIVAIIFCHHYVFGLCAGKSISVLGIRDGHLPSRPNPTCTTAMGSGFIVTYYDDPLVWLRVFQTWYGLPIFILFALISTVIGAFKGERRLLNQLILFWSVPFMVYIAFALVICAKHFPCRFFCQSFQHCPLISPFLRLRNFFSQLVST